MSKTLVRTTSVLIASSSANAEKWRGVRSVFGLVTEIGASAPSRKEKKSDHFVAKAEVPAAPEATKGEIRPDEAEALGAEAAVTEAVTEAVASAPSEAADTKAAYAAWKKSKKAKAVN